MRAPNAIGVVAVSLGMLALAPTAAAADPTCVLPVACDAPLDLDDGVPDPGEALGDPAGAVDEVEDAVDDTVGPVIRPVEDLLDDLLGDDDTVEPPGGGPGHGHGSVVDGRGGGREPSPAGPAAVLDGLDREGVRPDTLIGSAASGAQPELGRTRSPSAPGNVVEAAVRGLLLLAVLFGVAVGFVLAQSRLDRRDPRVVGVPARAEVVTFV